MPQSMPEQSLWPFTLTETEPEETVHRFFPLLFNKLQINQKLTKDGTGKKSASRTLFFSNHYCHFVFIGYFIVLLPGSCRTVNYRIVVQPFVPLDR
jgi:hypothetical protein